MDSSKTPYDIRSRYQPYNQHAFRYRVCARTIIHIKLLSYPYAGLKIIVPVRHSARASETQPEITRRSGHLFTVIRFIIMYYYVYSIFSIWWHDERKNVLLKTTHEIFKTRDNNCIGGWLLLVLPENIQLCDSVCTHQVWSKNLTFWFELLFLKIFWIAIFLNIFV